MNYEAVFVDWDGTLSDSRFWGHWQEHPEYAEKYDKVQQALFESPEGQEINRKWMVGWIKYPNVMRQVANMTEIPAEELTEGLQHSAENMSLIDMRVLGPIQRLRDMGKQVVIATDNMDTFNRWTVPKMRLYDYFDDVLNSHKIQKLKSDMHSIQNRSEFFYRYLNDMGIAPENTVLIDNSLGAKCIEAVGMNFLHVTDEQPLLYHLRNIERTSEK